MASGDRSGHCLSSGAQDGRLEVSDPRNRRRGLRRSLARPACTPWSGNSIERRNPQGNSSRLAGGCLRSPVEISRGGDIWIGDCVGLFAERQSRSVTQFLVQATLVRTIYSARNKPLFFGRTCCDRRRLERRPNGLRYLQSGVVAVRRGDATGDQRSVSTATRFRLDRYRKASSPERAHVHVLGERERVSYRSRLQNGFHSDCRKATSAFVGGRRGRHPPRPRKTKRSRRGLDNAAQVRLFPRSCGLRSPRHTCGRGNCRRGRRFAGPERAANGALSAAIGYCLRSRSTFAEPSAVLTSRFSSGGGRTAGSPSDFSQSSRHQPLV